MFSLFTRNYVGAFIGMLFFLVLFFTNIDMILQSKSLLTESWIPNFVGWFAPLMLFLYFWVFFLLYNRFLYGCKHVKKSLKLLLLIVSILYWLWAWILLILILTGYSQWVIYMIIMGLLAFKNIYFYTKVQHKKFFTKIKSRDFLKYISIYWIIITLSLLFYTRPLVEVEYPKDYFNINIKSLSENIDKIEAIWDFWITDYLRGIANQKDKNADYGVIIYNLPKETLEEINSIYAINKDLLEFKENIDYSYTHLISAQKVSLVKFEYEVLHKEYNTAIETIIHILKTNQQILKTNKNLSDFTAYIDIEKLTIEKLKKYISVFSKEQYAVLNIELTQMDTKEIWKDALEQDFNHRLASISYLYNIPLLIDKEEMLYVSLYQEYLKSENITSAIDNKQYKSIFRKNYFGLSILEKNVPDFESAYQKLSDLEQLNITLKNTLN